MAKQPALKPEMRALYDSVAKLYNAGKTRPEIEAELGIDGVLYRRAYHYLHFYKIISRKTRVLKPKAARHRAVPKPALPAAEPAPKPAPVSIDTKAAIADYIASKGSHVCQDRFNCKLPGIHLVTRHEGDADFVAPVIVHPKTNKNPGWKTEFQRHVSAEAKRGQGVGK